MPRRLNQLPPARKRRRLDETTTTSTPASRDTTPLSENEIFGLSNAMQKEYGWSHDQVVRPFQMAGIQAQLESVDMIIQAPTGAGKTVIVAGAHLSPRAKGTITLLSVPLVQLAEDMVCNMQFSQEASSFCPATRLLHFTRSLNSVPLRFIVQMVLSLLLR